MKAGLAVGALCLASAAVTQSNQAAPAPLRNPASTPAWEALYKQRFEALMRDRGVMTSYDPMEPIAGAKSYRSIPAVSPSQGTIAPQALDQAAAYAAASNARAFLVWRDGKMERADYSRGSDSKTQMVSKSLSKPLTAIAVGRAIALGKIKSLDQPMTDFIPEWSGTPKATMQLRHLLDMRSGFLEQDYSPDPDNPLNRAYIDPDHGWQIVHNYPLTHKPGTYYGYSNAVSELVALVIERATGTRYGPFVSQQILQPIGAMGGEIWVDRPGGLAHSGCCMTLPAESWLRLGILLLNDGVANGKRLLPKGYVDAMATGTPQNPHYGMGVWVAGPYAERRGFGAPGRPGPQVLHSAPYRDKDLFLFDGNSDQVVYISRAAKLVALRIGDSPPAKPEWDNSILPNLLIDGIKWQAGERRPIPQPKP
ncbi:serine hydrolase domain-containing protein [Sphingobium sp. HWE2-09]|uniref:serine hydrolase domain-containing protein n=1 Tax=Sphingobium sp. HWE2-09 TaxID=3108390 RepID=UPI002DC390DC|nr:serine hydrolase [Sphingobium sp. HWE2-09]